MKLEEAKKKLNYHKQVLIVADETGTENDLVETIETVLQELENSISKDKVKEIQGKIQLEYEKNIEKNPTYAFVLKCKLEILEELLEEK